MNHEAKINGKDGCACGAVRLPCMELGQWVDCANCARGPRWEPDQDAWRCPVDGRIEPSQGCSGMGIED